MREEFKMFKNPLLISRLLELEANAIQEDVVTDLERIVLQNFLPRDEKTSRISAEIAFAEDLTVREAIDMVKEITMNKGKFSVADGEEEKERDAFAGIWATIAAVVDFADNKPEEAVWAKYCDYLKKNLLYTDTGDVEELFAEELADLAGDNVTYGQLIKTVVFITIDENGGLNVCDFVDFVLENIPQEALCSIFDDDHILSLVMDIKDYANCHSGFRLI